VLSSGRGLDNFKALHSFNVLQGLGNSFTRQVPVGCASILRYSTGSWSSGVYSKYRDLSAD